MLVLATLGAPERRTLLSRRAQRRSSQSEPGPTPVATGRATVIDVGSPFSEEADAATWIKQAGEDDLAADLAVLNRVVYAFRIVTADPYVGPVGRHHLLIARVGYGIGEEVADGLWTDARELLVSEPRQRRKVVLHPQARLAALLGNRAEPLASEELALRARLDLDYGRYREAALQLLVALDAAIAELGGDRLADQLEDRLVELREQRDPVAATAQNALAGPLGQDDLETIVFALGRIEAALRARAAASG
ncbi:hypothetical protein AYO39_00705 [Actinobacteria bacterium SCGC AG-212-D09]|nr:hypothetical protein AYO39_00705 [Actinobacteria bacterium SCGC AG-212-D09]